MYLNYRLPDIPVNPIPYPDFFLFTNMCILRRISNSEKAGKLISVRSIDEMFHILRFVANYCCPLKLFEPKN